MASTAESIYLYARARAGEGRGVRGEGRGFGGWGLRSPSSVDCATFQCLLPLVRKMPPEAPESILTDFHTQT